MKTPLGFMKTPLGFMKTPLGFMKESLGFIHGLFLISKLLFIHAFRIRPKQDLICLFIEQNLFLFLGIEGWYTRSVPFNLVLYLPMNRMLVTIRTEFSQFQSTRCIVSILLSNISGSAPRFFLELILDTIGTLQNNYPSNIFTLGHEPPLDLLNSSIFDPNRRRRKEREINRRTSC